MTLEQLADLAIAAREGKTLQCTVNDSWVDVPAMDFMRDIFRCYNRPWRIKPELREWWANEYLSGGNISRTWHSMRKEADGEAALEIRFRKRLLHLKEIEVIEFP